jgi:hypothetical protein
VCLDRLGPQPWHGLKYTYGLYLDTMISYRQSVSYTRPVAARKGLM